jgi:hypothetical protein
MAGNPDQALVQQLNDWYSALADPEGLHVDQATEALLGIYESPESFFAILDVIQTSRSPEVHKHALVGLNSCVRCHVDDFRSSPPVLASLVALILSADDLTAASVLFSLQLLMSHSSVPHITEITTAQSAGQDAPGRALRIFAALLDYPSGRAVDFGLIHALIDGAAASGDVAPVAAFQLAYLKSADEGDANIQPFLQSSTEIFAAFVGCQDLPAVELLSSLVENVVRYDYELIEPLLTVSVSHLSNPEIGFDTKLLLVSVIDVIVQSRLDLGDLRASYGDAIVSGYVDFSVQNYDRTKSYHESLHALFAAIVPDLRDIRDIWGDLPGLFESSSGGRFTVVSILLAGLKSCDFFRDKISQVFEWFAELIVCDELCLKSVSAFAICEFLPKFELDDSGQLVDALVRGFVPNLALDFLTCLEQVLDCSMTDLFFDRCFEWLVELRESVGDSFLQERVMNCLVTLSKRSKQRISFHFDELSPLLISLLDDSPNFAAVSCLARLCESCQAQMAPFVSTFIEFLLTHLTAFECVDAYGFIVDFFPDEVRPTVESVVPQLFELANRADDVEEEETDDDETFSFQNAVAASAAALRVLCQLCRRFPELGTHNVHELLERYRLSGSGDGTLSCACGLGYLCEAGFEREMGTMVFQMIRSAQDPATLAAALRALSKAPELLAEDEAVNCLALVFEGSLLFQRGVFGGNPEVNRGIEDVLRGMEHPEKLFPLMTEMLHSANEALARVAFRFFCRVCHHIPEEQQGMIAAWAIESGDVDSLTNLVKAVPEVMAARLDGLLGIVREKFDRGSVSEIEQSVLLLWALAAKGLVAVEPFVGKACQVIPPEVLIVESAKCFRFVEMLVASRAPELVGQALGCLVRLFAETRPMIRSRRIPEEFLLLLRQMTKAALAEMPNFAEFCGGVLAGDQFRLQTLEANLAD